MSELKHIQLFVAGDSTAASYPDHEAPMAGWGQLLQEYFQEEARVFNVAKCGATTQSFIDSGRLKIIGDNIREGDYLFVQFGHNDQKPRGTLADSTYKENLLKFIQVARKKKAIPILLTSVNRRKFDENGKQVHTLAEFPQATRDLAKMENLTCIDLLEKTRILYEGLGIEGSKSLFCIFDKGEQSNYPDGLDDNTHFCEDGAKKVAGLVVEGIREQLPELAKYLK